MEKAYIVTAGEYSDYRVVGVFTDKDKAKVFKESLNIENDIEEYELNPKAPYTDGYYSYYVEFDKTGNAKVKEQPAIRVIDAGEDCVLVCLDGRVFVDVFAESPEHAVKIASEKRRIAILQRDEEKLLNRILGKGE